METYGSAVQIDGNLLTCVIVARQFPLRLHSLPRTQIPTKIEVYVSAAAEDPAAAKRLGYLSFDSNERSSHQARELKSVHVNVHAYVVRLVIHRCHVNKLNIYNQVRCLAV